MFFICFFIFCEFWTDVWSVFLFFINEIDVWSVYLLINVKYHTIHLFYLENRNYGPYICIFCLFKIILFVYVLLYLCFALHVTVLYVFYVPRICFILIDICSSSIVYVFFHSTHLFSIILN